MKRTYQIFMWGFFVCLIGIGVSWRFVRSQYYDLSYPDHHLEVIDSIVVRKYEYSNNKILPSSIKEACLEVLSYYPELKNTQIRIFFTKTVGPTMQARPPWYFLFVPKPYRVYEIRISNNTELAKGIRISDLSENVLKGWIAHELGHIMDYDRRSRWQLLNFVLGYLISPNFKEGAERTADLYALQHGFGDELVLKKKYILNHNDLSAAYKARILRYYLSPEEILTLIGREVEVPFISK